MKQTCAPLIELKLSDLKAAEFPLRPINDNLVSELMQSIRNAGILQPISVRACEDGYQVVFGNHRIEACRRLGIERIPAIINQFTEDEAFLARVAENILRNSYTNPIEEAKGYSGLLRRGWTITEIAHKIGKVDSYVSERLSLLDRLDSHLQSDLCNGDPYFTASHAELLSRISDPTRQKEIARLVRSRRLSVRALEDLIKHVPLPAKTKVEAAPGGFCISIPNDFAKALGLKVGEYLRIYVRGSKLVLESWSSAQRYRKKTENGIPIMSCATAD